MKLIQKTKRIVTLSILLIPICLLSLGEATQFKVTYIKGLVKVKRNGKAIAVRKGMLIREKDQLVSRKNSFVAVKGTDGTILKITAGTIMDFKKTYEDSKVRRHRFGIHKGKISTHVSKLQKKSSVLYETPSIVAAVRGTSFVLDVQNSGETKVFLESGTLQAIDKESLSAANGFSMTDFQASLENTPANEAPANAAVKTINSGEFVSVNEETGPGVIEVGTMSQADVQESQVGLPSTIGEVEVDFDPRGLGEAFTSTSPEQGEEAEAPLLEEEEASDEGDILEESFSEEVNVEDVLEDQGAGVSFEEDSEVEELIDELLEDSSEAIQQINEELGQEELGADVDRHNIQQHAFASFVDEQRTWDYETGKRVGDYRIEQFYESSQLSSGDETGEVMTLTENRATDEMSLVTTTFTYTSGGIPTYDDLINDAGRGKTPNEIEMDIRYVQHDNDADHIEYSYDFDTSALPTVRINGHLYQPANYPANVNYNGVIYRGNEITKRTVGPATIFGMSLETRGVRTPSNLFGQHAFEFQIELIDQDGNAIAPFLFESNHATELANRGGANSLMAAMSHSLVTIRYVGNTLQGNSNPAHRLVHSFNNDQVRFHTLMDSQGFGFAAYKGLYESFLDRIDAQ